MSRCYLMSVGEFHEGVEGEKLLNTALEKIDSTRREKALKMKPGRSQAASVGAGLLLQLAVQEVLRTDERGIAREERAADRMPDVMSGGVDRQPLCVAEGASGDSTEVDADGLIAKSEELRLYSALQVLKLVEKPIELFVDYGVKGKPYLKEYPLFFNLSHSGEYVVCAVSDREIGVDIQKCADLNVGRIAERFFSDEERRALEACGTEEERQLLFYRLWTRKEAYGKLLGEGIFSVVSENFLPDESGMVTEKGLFWLEWIWPEGYRIAVCQRA